MKKLFLVLILPMLFLCGYSQIYTPQYPTQYGQKVNRIKPLLSQHLPEKTLELMTMDSTAQIFLNTTDSSVWCWYKHKGFFKIGNDVPTLQQVITAGNVLTANNLIDLGTTSRLRIKGGKLYDAINFTAYDPANNDSSHITISGGYVTAIAMGVKRSNAGAYLNLSNNGFDFQTVSGVKTTTMTVFNQYNISAITDSTGFIMGKDSFLLTKSSSSTSFQNLDLFSYNNAAKFKWSPNGVVIRNGIGFYDNHSSAILDVYSKTKGVLLTRHTTAEMLAVPNPANGLVTYNTDSLAYCYFNGTAWKRIAGSESSMAISGNYGNIPILRNGQLVTTDSLRYVNERLESAGDFAWSKGGLFQNVNAGEAGLYGDLDDALAVKVGNSFEYKYANGLLTTRNDTVTVNGVVSSSNGILSTHNDATGQFSLDWNTGQPFFYFQSNDTTTGNEAFLEINAGGNIGLSITHSNVVGNASISATNGEVGLTATNKIYLNFVNGGGFEFVPGEAGYSKIMSTDGSQIIGHYKNGNAPGIITLGDNVWTTAGFTGGLTIDAGSLTVSQGDIRMGMTNNAIIFDYDDEKWNTINYDYNDAYGYGTTGAMLYRSNNSGHMFWIAEEGREAARIDLSGVRVPNVNGTSGSTLGTAYNDSYSSGLYSGNNDTPIAEFYEGGNIGNTNKYRYAGEKFWINAGAASIVTGKQIGRAHV